MPMNRYMYIFALLLILTLSGTALAEMQLTAKAVMTTDQHYYAKWGQTIGLYTPPIMASSKVYRGEIFQIRYLLIGMALSQINECDVTADLELTSPQGKPILSKKDTKVLKEMVFNRNMYYVPASYEQVRLSDTDTLGKYHLKVTFHDKIANKDVISESDIELVAYGSDQLSLTDSQLERLMFTYYQTPDSHRILDLFKVVYKYVDANGLEMAYIFGPMYRVFMQDNPYLMPHLTTYIKELPAEQRKKILPIIKAVAIDYKDFIEKLALSAEEKTILDAVTYPDLLDEQVNLLEVDMLSALFYASGEITPVQHLIRMIKLSDSTDETAKAIGKYAINTVGKNCLSHKLFRAYCMVTVNGDLTLDESTSAIMQTIFDNTD